MESERPKVMQPPEGFIERAVDQALAQLRAEEARPETRREWLRDELDEVTEADEMAAGCPDSGIFGLGDDGPPTIPFVRAEGR